MPTKSSSWNATSRRIAHLPKKMASSRSLPRPRAGILTRMGVQLRFKVLSLLAVVAVGATGLVVACGGDDGGGPRACTGADCDGGASSETSTTDSPSGDGSTPPEDGGADADADSSVTMNCGDGGAPGTLDETFGDGGILWLKYPTSAALAVAVQSDGKILLGGATNGSSGSFAVVRLLANGTPDPTFANNGLSERSVAGNINPEIHALALQADGRIVGAGQIRFTGQEFDIAVLRYLSDGGADPTFGDGGLVTTDFSARADKANSVVVQPDGRILVAGQSLGAASSSSDFALVRYKSDGSLDTTFGNGGKVLVDIHGTADVGGFVALAAGGKIAVAGHSLGTTSNASRRDLVTAMLKADGTLDTTFADGGTFVTNFGGPSGVIGQVGRSIAIDSSGRILLSGTYGADFGTARLSPLGSLDPAFGDGGAVLTDFNGRGDDAFAVLLQEDGRMLVAGLGTSGASPPDTTIQTARYKANGALDSTFGLGGQTVTTPATTTSYDARGAALAGCGIVVVGGWGYNETTIPDNAMGIAKYRR